jgi:hypothetical protein
VSVCEGDSSKKHVAGCIYKELLVVVVNYNKLSRHLSRRDESTS